MSESELPSEEPILVCWPRFDLWASVNGHLTRFELQSGAYQAALEDDEVDAFNYLSLWCYFSKHLPEYLLDVTDVLGPIDPDRVKLISMGLRVITGPDGVDESLDCDDCKERYQFALDHNTEDEDEEDD